MWTVLSFSLFFPVLMLRWKTLALGNSGTEHLQRRAEKSTRSSHRTPGSFLSGLV